MTTQTLERVEPRQAARPSNEPARPSALSKPVYQAYQILRWGFAAAPILAGLDKFAYVLVDWSQYLSPLAIRTLPFSASTFMRCVGVIEIAAGLLVAFKPRYGGYVVAAWLAGIIVNLLAIPGYFDIALRDFGLALGALALARLSSAFDR